MIKFDPFWTDLIQKKSKIKSPFDRQTETRTDIEAQILKQRLGKHIYLKKETNQYPLVTLQDKSIISNPLYVICMKLEMKQLNTKSNLI